MKPSQTAEALRHIATAIENSNQPDRNLVVRDLNMVLASLHTAEDEGGDKATEFYIYAETSEGGAEASGKYFKTQEEHEEKEERKEEHRKNRELEGGVAAAKTVYVVMKHNYGDKIEDIKGPKQIDSSGKTHAVWIKFKDEMNTGEVKDMVTSAIADDRVAKMSIDMKTLKVESA